MLNTSQCRLAYLSNRRYKVFALTSGEDSGIFAGLAGLPGLANGEECLGVDIQSVDAQVREIYVSSGAARLLSWECNVWETCFA